MTRWQSTVKRLAKQGYSGPSLMRAASRAYKGGRGRNPWVRGYKYHRRGRKKATRVKTYWKPKGTRKKYPKPRGRGKPRYGTKAWYRWIGRKGALARKRGKRAANPRRRNPRRRNPAPRPFTYALSPSVSANPYVKANRRRRKPARRRNSRRSNPRRRNPRRRNQPFRYTIPAGVVANPYVKANVFSNPSATMTMSAKNFIMGFTVPAFWINEVLPLGGGFVGAKVISGLLIPMLFKKKWDSDPAFVATIKKWKPAIEIGSALVAGLGVGFATKRTDMAVKITTGGILAALVSLLEKQPKYIEYAEKLDGLGQVSEEMKSKLAKAVQDRLSSGVEQYDLDYATEEDTGWMDGADGVSGVDAFATEEDTVGGVSGGMSLDQFNAMPVI